MRKLNAEKIELINAHGPYNHAVWDLAGVKISNEERLSGRVELLAEKIRESILNNFSRNEIKKMSVVDVGCYDGWILQQLSDLPFSKMVGIEPRESNISKGKAIRKILNLKSKVKFRVGDIDSLGREKFDIVICTGVLHHLDSIPQAIHNLCSISKKMLFIETITLSPKNITKSLEKEIEMKDIAYFGRAKRCGLTGQKFESSYYDGSTNKLRVVSIPSVESLLMYLSIEGFNNAKIVVEPESYNSIWKKRGRSAEAVAICALSNEEKEKLFFDESVWVKDYELGLMKTVLDRGYIEPLYKLFHSQKISLKNPFFLLTSFLYIRSPNWLSGFFRNLSKIWLKDKYALEIIKNLRFSPKDKLSLEYGKILYKEKDYQAAISVLKDIVQKVNADWRSVYRAFYLLSQICGEIGLGRESKRYRDLCLTCNSKFPIRGEI